MKIVHNNIFPNSLHISFYSVTQRSLVNMLHITGFDGVLGGVTGVVFSVVCGVLSNFVIFTLDVIVGMTTSGSN